MLSYIKGSLEEVIEGIVVIENNGIGYEINTSFNTIAQLPEIGSDVKLYTKLVPREDAIILYGFYSNDELKMFELLMTVSGIGPKASLAILSSMTIDDIKFAILGEDSKAFSKVPGVGKKTADRAILELKDKMDLIDAFEGKLTSVKKSSPKMAPSVRDEVLEALIALGYSASAAAKALDMMPINEHTTTEQLLSDTLRQLSFL